MKNRCAVSLVLNAHLPFIKESSTALHRLSTEVSAAEDTVHAAVDSLIPVSVEESWFFEALSETYLPLLAAFDRLEADHIPFNLSIALSPVLAQMLGDEYLLKKYADCMDRQINFGKDELKRLEGNADQYKLAQYYFDHAVERYAAFTTRYEGSIIKALHYYQRKGRIEFLAAPATHAFLPFLARSPEAVQAQMETALSYYRYTLGISPQGFWLPELGWTNELDQFLRSYGFWYTITDSHGFVFGDPPPSQGSFFPVRTPRGIIMLSRDFRACSNIAAMRKEGLYRDNNRDIGYELSSGPFLAQNGARYQTGFKYRQNSDQLYNPYAARAAAEDHARAFIENASGTFESVSRYMYIPQNIDTQEPYFPISVCAFNADSFGRQWYEGSWFMESLFRLASSYRSIQFVTPSEYLYQQSLSAFEVSTPEYSSWGENGYAETWLDSSNDWVYRHLNRSIDRMVELADRFSGNSGLKERALNQAAREIFLAMSSDWPGFLYRQECTGYAKSRIEDSLQNFTTIYEALGSNYISAEWLTTLERRNNIFPNINYRVFKRKR